MQKFRKLPLYSLVPSGVIPGYDGDGEGGDGGAAGGDGGAGSTVTMDEVNKTVNNAVANLRKSDLPKLIEAGINPLKEKITGFSSTLEEIKNSLSGGGDGGSGNGGSGGEGGGSGGSTIPPEVNTQLRNLGETVKSQGETIQELTTSRDEALKSAEAANRKTFIHDAFKELNFVTPKAADTAYSLVEPHVKRTDENDPGSSLVAGDNLTVEAFAKEFLSKEHPYLLKAASSSGSGASGGSSGVSGKSADLDEIKPGMNPEKRAATIAAIQSALPQTSN